MVASFLIRAGGLVTAASSTWNPSDKGSEITLSGGDLIATVSPDGGGVRSTTSKASGKWHFEGIWNNSGSSTGIGLANSTAALTPSSAYMGEDGNSVVNYNNGTVFLNAGNLGSITSFTTNVVTVEVDIDAELLWFGVDGGSWNNNGSADPATGTGGISFAAANAGPWFIGASMFGSGSGVTLRTAAASFTRSISSGFSAWG
jgi:hypothetical protein